MSIAASFIPELDHEVASTRKILERVPDERLAWQPHAKSMTLGRLASHISELPSFGTWIMTEDDFDFMGAPGRPKWAPTILGSRAEILANLARTSAEARAALSAASDESMGQVWTMRAGPRVVVELPRAAAYRSVMMSHLIHHRGQLSVYLRLCDVVVPGMYGPSNDESLG